MAYELNDTQLALLKRYINDGGSSSDADVRQASLDVKNIMKDYVGVFEQAAQVFKFRGTDAAYIDLKIYLTRSITTIKMDNQDDDEVTLDSGSYFLSIPDRRIYRDPGYTGTVTDPDDGVTFQRVDNVPTPWTITLVVGYDDSDGGGGDYSYVEDLPAWLVDGWIEATAKYWNCVRNIPRMVSEPLMGTSKKSEARARKMTMDEFRLHLQNKYWTPNRFAGGE